ncbi:lantibiotic biosynthesis protein [Carnobacterium divergens]|uniref:thiopeptide-type bacteriocin biosynthesis protein n=1 Tax=Carnobacterium divergens TaxID=2748 RepID=UPI001071E30F|nr:thiopeptide-type bacteriocin biosynthesis protein [Carnobacterium divergens]TFI60645.1 lantibiotic biosynthesis protein [Carnobacterium divergens]TFI61405.1 lantibiotic biosynthesis protein [Carnobacterium divergens]TFI77321.1 lantibiotic biosynthesis protein [Carnobacterium divergens]TFJ01102.1 lantibiotic biosynthesis protein [Carnobacterium divergens]TFJ09144.1 lantibiotic biosynthesis protein [Carnobacterium divergens]
MWKSKHIFIHDYQLLEKFLKDKLLPYLDEENVQYFFIRYWDGGPHIRLRYKLSETLAKNFENGIKVLLSKFQEKYRDFPFEAVAYNPTIVQTEDIEPALPYPNFSIQAVDYIPELYRYGGEEGLELSEKLFEHSSRFAAEIIQKLNRNQRYTLAIDIMYSCAAIARKLGYFEQNQEFFKAYRKIWMQFSEHKIPVELKEALEKRIVRLQNGELDLQFYQPYLSIFKSIIYQIKQCQTTMDSIYAYYIVISHLHMLNNRLGVSPEYEFIFSNALVKAE